MYFEILLKLVNIHFFFVFTLISISLTRQFLIENSLNYILVRKWKCYEQKFVSRERKSESEYM